MSTIIGLLDLFKTGVPSDDGAIILGVLKFVFLTVCAAVVTSWWNKLKGDD